VWYCYLLFFWLADIFLFAEQLNRDTYRKLISEPPYKDKKGEWLLLLRGELIASGSEHDVASRMMELDDKDLPDVYGEQVC
jgi:hypothetical protein